MLGSLQVDYDAFETSTSGRHFRYHCYGTSRTLIRVTTFGILFTSDLTDSKHSATVVYGPLISCLQYY